MSTATTPNPASKAEREIRFAWMFLGGTFVALLFNGIWSTIVGTASFGGEESDLVQGWEGVLRNSPAYLLLVVVASAGVWYAALAGIHGSEGARSALLATSLVLLFALSSVTRDAAEVVMTTRAATVSWMTFGVNAVLVGLVYFMVRNRTRRASSH